MLDLVAGLQAELHTAVLFISHNLGVIAKMCDRVGVLYAGRLVEEGPVDTVLQDPRHPYTVGLLRCIPRGGVRKDRGRLDTIPGSCRASGSRSQAASSPIAAPSPTTGAARRSPRSSGRAEPYCPLLPP